MGLGDGIRRDAMGGVVKGGREEKVMGTAVARNDEALGVACASLVFPLSCVCK